LLSARIPPGFAELWLAWSTSGDAEQMFTSIGLDLATGVTPSQTNTDALTAIARSALDDICSADYQVGGGHIIWGQDGSDIRIDSANNLVTGLTAGSALPPNCAYLVRKLTDLGGRRARGRMFIPGVPEGTVGANGVLTGAGLTAVNTAVLALLTNLEGNAAVEGLVLFHDTAPFTPTPITSLEAQSKIATQRRRMRP
jgi:hypothetical protein